MNFAEFYQAIKQQHEADIVTFIKSRQLPDPLGTACLYAMTNGGKRVRPLLVAASFYSVMATTPTCQPLPITVRQAMLAVECLHGYSLVHDDLPCMDDDDLRRGRPTTHIAFGEAAALLAGDGLPAMAARLLDIFAPCTRRMVSGQMLDLNGEQQVLTQEQLQAIHHDKTGALIEAAVMMGATCAAAEPQRLFALRHAASQLGLAFQVQDDILDITADPSQLGKPVGSDEKLDKSTYVKLMGLAAADAYAKQLFSEAKHTISHTLGENNYLLDLINWLWQRQY